MLPRSAAIPLLLLAVFGLGQVRAQLPARSPFVFPEAAAETARREQVLEFDGFVSTPAGTEFIVLDKARKARAWLRLNQRNSDFDLVARKYDAENATLTVERGGGVEVLPMRRPKIISGGAPVPYRPVSVAPLPSTPPPTTAVASAQALEQVVADVQARRAAREQSAIQAAGAPAAGQSPVRQR
jgi:hypothetical protein